jgi:DNA-binding NarL/FixJ family response regulator
MVSRCEDIFPLGEMYLRRFGCTNMQGTSEDGDALSMRINDEKPGLVLMESSFYKTATPYKIGELKRDMPYVCIAVFNLGDYPEDLEEQFIKFGAESYITLREGLRGFNRGLEAVVRGGVYISEAVQRRMDSAGDDTVLRPDKSAREHAVMELLVDGATTREIKEVLKISFRTVEHHKTNMFARLQVANTVQMIRRALYIGELNIDRFMGVKDAGKKQVG